MADRRLIDYSIDSEALQAVDRDEETTESGRLAAALLEAADDKHRVGVMDEATHEKITLRHLGNGSGVQSR